MNFIDVFLNSITSLIGGSLLILVSFISLFSSIAALLSISEENRIFFQNFKRIYGIVIASFGIMLHFRGISFLATLLSFIWASFFWDLFSKWTLFQIALATFGSLIIWIYNFCFTDIIFLQIVGDSLLFILIPFAIAIVDLSRGSELLSGRERSNSHAPFINLRSFLSKCNSLVERIFPPD